MKKTSPPLHLVANCLSRIQSILLSKGISIDTANPINPDPNGRINMFDAHRDYYK